MPIPQFYTPDDSVKYLKNFHENVDSYLAALDYVKERIYGCVPYKTIQGETLDVLCKLTNKLIEDTNYDFAQIYPEYKNIEEVEQKVFYLENFRQKE
jgi:uncharacterized protein YoxC